MSQSIQSKKQPPNERQHSQSFHNQPVTKLVQQKHVRYNSVQASKHKSSMSQKIDARQLSASKLFTEDLLQWQTGDCNKVEQLMTGGTSLLEQQPSLNQKQRRVLQQHLMDELIGSSTGSLIQLGKLSSMNTALTHSQHIQTKSNKAFQPQDGSNS